MCCQLRWALTTAQATQGPDFMVWSIRKPECLLLFYLKSKGNGWCPVTKLERVLRTIILYKSRFATQINQDRLMSVSSWSRDQLRVSLSLQHFLMADVGRGCVWILAISWESGLQSKGYKITHVTKIVDLWVVWLDLRHTRGQYCHPSNTAQSGFRKENEGTWLRKTLPIQPFPQTGILFALRYIVGGRKKKKKRYEQSQGAEMPPSARSVLCQGGPLEYHTSPRPNSPCPPSPAAAHIFGKETRIR